MIWAIAVAAFAAGFSFATWHRVRRLDAMVLKLRERVTALELQSKVAGASLECARQELETVSDAFAALVQGRLHLRTPNGIVRIS